MSYELSAKKVEQIKEISAFLKLQNQAENI